MYKCPKCGSKNVLEIHREATFTIPVNSLEGDWEMEDEGEISFECEDCGEEIETLDELEEVCS